MTGLDNLLKNIDEAVTSGVIKLSNVNYDAIFFHAKKQCKEKKIEQFLVREFSNVWLNAYEEMIKTNNEVLEFSDGHYQCLFDYTL